MAKERNLVLKDRRKVRIKFALAYPNVYNVGMSNLAVRLLYEYINDCPDALCERFFFTQYGDIPRSVESGLPLTEYDAIGFSLQHEMDYIRMLDMLSASGIPIRRSKRKSPIVIAGGPSVTSNPLPLSPFVDFFLIGEAEPILDEMLSALGSGHPRRDLGSISGFYTGGGSAERVIVSDLDTAFHPVRQVHALKTNEFSSTFLLEVSRGCGRGCRFCMECFLYQPKRQRSLRKIEEILDNGIALTTLRKVTCISSAFFDHTQLHGILSSLRSRNLSFSLPSLRISAAGEGLMELLAAGGQRSITIAPETPSARLRDVINKRYDENMLKGMLTEARQAGINSLKIYLMVGIPGERPSDLGEMEALLNAIISSGFGSSSLHISVNPMIPKSQTPFQWSPFIGLNDYRERISLLRGICSKHGVRRFEFMDHRWGEIQAYLSTSGVEASHVLEALTADITAGGGGDLGSWRRVLRSMGMSLGTLHSPPGLDAELPWEAIKGATSKSHLMGEYRRAMSIASGSA